MDIDADMNADLAERVQEKDYKNIEIILARPDDPNLADNSIDLVFSSNSYHHLKDRVKYFSDLHQDLKPRARVAIIDFTGEDAPLTGHATSSETIKRELSEAGYTLEEKLDFLPKQGFLIFNRTQP